MEYANVVWNPHSTQLLTDKEGVQKKATKLVKGLGKLSYRERLIRLHLPTLKVRRLRGDMIKVFKILTGKYDREVSSLLPRSENVRTRGNSQKLKVERSRYVLGKYSFTSRVVNTWSTLPDHMC